MEYFLRIILLVEILENSENIFFSSFIIIENKFKTRQTKVISINQKCFFRFLLSLLIQNTILIKTFPFVSYSSIETIVLKTNL